LVAVVSLVSPYRADRDRVRALHHAAGLRFVEVFVDTPLAVCEGGGPKGLDAKAPGGGIRKFTGIGGPYEAPLHPDLVLRPGHGSPAAMADWVISRLDG